MRDNRQHRALLLAGMWGMKVGKDREMAMDIFNEMYSVMGQMLEKNWDQQVLRTVMLPRLNGSALIHDRLIFWDVLNANTNTPSKYPTNYPQIT